MRTRRPNAAMCLLIGVAAAAAASGACAGKKYGSSGRSIPLKLDSTPPGAQVFLVPLTEWHGGGGEALLATPEKLEPYRRGDLLTPADTEVPPKKFAYVAIKRDAATAPMMAGYKYITPTANVTYTVALKAR